MSGRPGQLPRIAVSIRISRSRLKYECQTPILNPSSRIGAAECLRAVEPIPETAVPAVIVSTAAEPVTPGKFQPTWDSLKQYQAPDWFRDAKFGIWAVFGPQCEPEDGDWYARNMYVGRRRAE